MKRILLILAAALFCINISAQEVNVTEFLYHGPFEVKKPFIADSSDVNGRKYNESDLLKSNISVNALTPGAKVLTVAEDGKVSLPTSGYPYSIGIASFYLTSDRYETGTLTIDAPRNAEIYVDDRVQRLTNKTLRLTTEPAHRYEIKVKYLSKADDTLSLKSSFKGSDSAIVKLTTSPEKYYTLTTMSDGKRVSGASVSPNGKYLMISYVDVIPNSGGAQARNTGTGGGTQGQGQTQQAPSATRVNSMEVRDRVSGKVLMTGDPSRSYQWMPTSNLLYYVRQSEDGRELVTVDPATLAENVVGAGIPTGSFRLSPTEDFVLYSQPDRGPEERNREVREILEPADRQGGFRSRSFIYRYDFKTGISERLTFGKKSTSVQDISEDGRYLLFSSSSFNITERPFSINSLYIMDMETREVKTLFTDEKFFGSASFSPDGKQLMITASPEAFGGIGQNVAPGQIPNFYDIQLFIYNIVDGKIVPLTKDFNPSIDRAVWSNNDKQIYAMATNRDYVSLYTIDPIKGTIKEIPAMEEVVTSMSVANHAPVMLYGGMSASNVQRIYEYDMKKGKSTILEDMSKNILKDVVIGEFDDWNFKSKSGETIYGRYYLPPGFDPEKKYPMLVYYYGGVTPVNRVMESRWSGHMYAAMGFVVYVVQPSGAIGFGQEFSARHVNAWGKRTADDIIEGVTKFCDEHSFVNRDKVGCFGASYGGFMTQYLLTQTDIFAAGMSHAGISSISSYWGEGYWGYSYGAIANADSYPWNAPEIFAGQSPLFNADKINTPLLLLHGNADTNVPIGESIQMFTALKILGKEVSLVEVNGENHAINDTAKRIAWNNTIYAWFFKWLKDEPEWWNSMYPPKSL